VKSRVLSRFGVLIAILVMFSAGSTAINPASAASTPKGTVTFALPAGVVSTYIFPFATGSDTENVNLFQMWPFLWRPLYWYGDNGNVGINWKESVGEPPAYSNGGRTVTITLKKTFTWSDGKPITNRDVELWMNIFMAERENYLAYTVGSIPDDITSMSFPAATPYQFSLTFNKTYSHQWLLYDQLSQIWPIPQQAWDRTSATGPVGNYDTTTAGAKKVYNFLNAQSENETTYATNPLWKTVDGPWLVQAFSSSTGYNAFVPNPHYTGPGKPKIAKFEELPFTSSAAEFDALRSGQVDYGYLPTEDIAQESYFKSRGYKIDKWPVFGINVFALNFTNPKVGPIFKQLYIRQALQELVNQPQIAKDIWRGVATPTYGPIPDIANPFVSSKSAKNDYPYSLSGAKKLLSEHGWTVRPNGTDSCAKPGAGSGECGAGIAPGEQLSFVEKFSSGSAPFTAEEEDVQSSWAEAGVHVTLLQAPAGQLYSGLAPCSNGNAGCDWDIINLGAPGETGSYSPDYLPNGAQLWGTAGAQNNEGYSNAKMDSLIAASEFSSSPSAIKKLAAYVSQQLPLLFQPNYPYQLSVISPKLHGASTQDPNLNLYPQYWTWGS
jgi:peptide/nickel transport system substrate-binding protein